MKKFMIVFTLSEPSGDDLFFLLLRQRMYIHELMDWGIVTTYALNREQSQGWIGMTGDSRADIRLYISRFPMAHLMTTTIHELRLQDDEAYRIPKVHLN